MTAFLEKVARGIYRESYRRCCNGELPDDSDQSWRSYLGEARAAVEAMREPDKAMVGAGSCHCRDEMEEQDPETTRDCYQAMIGAALGEP